MFLLSNAYKRVHNDSVSLKTRYEGSVKIGILNDLYDIVEALLLFAYNCFVF